MSFSCLSFLGINITGYPALLVEGYIYFYYILLSRYSFSSYNFSDNIEYISNFFNISSSFTT